jgi:hypothetical protein
VAIPIVILPTRRLLLPLPKEGIKNVASASSVEAIILLMGLSFSER